MTEPFLAEYSSLCFSVKTLQTDIASNSLELDNLKDQETKSSDNLLVLESQINAQTREVNSGREKLSNLELKLTEKKEAIAQGCERNRQQQACK